MTTRLRNTPSRLTPLALAAAAVLALSACSTPAPATSSPPPSETPVAANPNTPSATPTSEPEPVVEVPTELQFTSTTVAGGEAFDGASLAGKNTILWFWAPWCPVCQAESGTVAEAMSELPEGVTIIGVSGRADIPAMQGFVDQYGVSGFEHLADVDGSVWSSFGISYQPAFAFIGEDGSIRTVPSVMSKADILAAANELVS